jgi:hypothetical protein
VPQAAIVLSARTPPLLCYSFIAHAQSSPLTCVVLDAGDCAAHVRLLGLRSQGATRLPNHRPHHRAGPRYVAKPPRPPPSIPVCILPARLRSLVQTQTRRTTTSCPTRGSPSRARTRRGKARPSPRHCHDRRRRASSDGFNLFLPPPSFSASSFRELSSGVFEVSAGLCLPPPPCRRVRDVRV